NLKLARNHDVFFTKGVSGKEPWSGAGMDFCRLTPTSGMDGTRSDAGSARENRPARAKIAGADWRSQRFARDREGWANRLPAGLRDGATRSHGAGSATDALQYRFDQQAIHRRGDTYACRAGESFARRSGGEVPSEPHASERGHDPAAAVAHLGLS